MCPSGPQSPAACWLLKHGPGELELLFQAIVYHPSVPILVADDQRVSKDFSTGMGRLLGLPREKIIGHRVDEFAHPDDRLRISQLWETLKAGKQQEGILMLAGADGSYRAVEYKARGNLLPFRHLLVLREVLPAIGQANSIGSEGRQVSSWVEDYALFLLDAGGSIATWYSGAERIYGYSAKESIGQHFSFVHPSDETVRADLERRLTRSVTSGHFASEGWHIRKSGDQFWANTVIMTLRQEDGTPCGFAVVVRDFTDRHERDEKLRQSRAHISPSVSHPSIAGIFSAEFDRIPEVNDAFLELVGYSREDVLGGKLTWSDLSPQDCAPLDELAHEECLRFGACTPYEKELIRRDGTRVPVLVSKAVLKLSPFRWITFVQDLRARNLLESVDAEDAQPRESFGDIAGNSAALRRMQRQVEVVAPTDANVLIIGETGTGKELVARAIHRMSPRRNLPFVTLNCAAIPTGLLESELFGYERGAFTGALSQKIGRFEMAHRGTLFLDEVGDIPLELQPKLLRALQEKSFERLGGTRTIPIDVRLVAATNRNLTQMMGDKLFRSDLYYRLKVFPIATPPLRDHPEDIPILARHFTKKYAGKMGKQIEKIPAETMRVLVEWHWPGNVRELENFIERSVILSSGTMLRAPISEMKADAGSGGSDSTLEYVEREHILRVLRECNGVVTRAATRLGLQRTTLHAMLRKLGISRKDL